METKNNINLISKNDIKFDNLYTIALDLDGSKYLDWSVDQNRTTPEQFQKLWDVIYNYGLDSTTYRAYKFFQENGSFAGETVHNLIDLHYDGKLFEKFNDIITNLISSKLELCIIFNSQTLDFNKDIRISMYIYFLSKLIENNIKTITLICPQDTFSEIEKVLSGNKESSNISIKILPIEKIIKPY